MTSWFPAEIDPLLVTEEQKPTVPVEEKSHIGHLRAAARDSSFQKTHLNFLHAAQGLTGRKQKPTVLLRACPKASTTPLLPYFIGESIRTKPRTN